MRSIRHEVLLALVLTALATLPAVAALTPGDYDRTLAFGGHIRTYRIHVPAAYTGSTPVPLVLDFHGLGSRGLEQALISGMIGVSDEKGFLVVHPDGVRNAWNAGICCGNDDIDDVGFVRALIDAVAAEGSVDRRRVYATGLSNGGAMSQFLACEAADVIAAAAPMAFPLPYRTLSACRPARSIPVLTVMGLTDHLVTYEDGPFPTAPDTFAYWHDVNGCVGTVPETSLVRGQSRCENYTRCANGVQTTLCSVVAREFPGRDFSGHILYFQDDFALGTVAWEFLSRFSLPDAVAPVRGDLAGTSELRVGMATRVRLPLAWTLTLGDGTWSATDDAGQVYTGSARRRGRNGRTWLLALTADSRAILDGIVTAQLAAATNAVGLLLGVEPGRRLVLRVDGAGRPTGLAGRFPVLRGGVPGAAIGRFTVHARR